MSSMVNGVVHYISQGLVFEGFWYIVGSLYVRIIHYFPSKRTMRDFSSEER
jgi:hypothetical protein